MRDLMKMLKAVRGMTPFCLALIISVWGMIVLAGVYERAPIPLFGYPLAALSWVVILGVAAAFWRGPD